MMTVKGTKFIDGLTREIVTNPLPDRIIVESIKEKTGYIFITVMPCDLLEYYILELSKRNIDKDDVMWDLNSYISDRVNEINKG